MLLRRCKPPYYQFVPGLTMFHIRPEGSPVHQGFNFYPIKELGTSLGGVLRIGPLTVWARYAYRARKFYLVATLSKKG